MLRTQATGILVSTIVMLGMILPGGSRWSVPEAYAQEWQVHQVTRGENLTLIANTHGVTVKELRDWNKLRSDELAIGQRLRIPQRDQEWYVGESGDSLSEIAKRHDIPLDYLRTLAISRISLDNIRNHQASWVTQGQAIGQLTLFYGANDLGSTMMEESVVSAAGTSHPLTRADLDEMIRGAGFTPARRDNGYNILDRAD